MLTFRDQFPQGDADKKWALVQLSARPLFPDVAEHVQKAQGVLAVAKACLHAPRRMLDAAGVLLRLHPGGLLTRQGIFDGDAHGAGMKFLHP